MKTALSPALIVALLLGTAVGQGGALENAKKAIAAGNHERALEILENAYDEVSKIPEGLSLLTSTSLKMGKFDRAVGYAVKLVDADGKNPESHRLAAQSFYWRADEVRQEPGATPGRIFGFYEEAVGYCDSGLGVKADDLEFWTLKAHSYYWLEKQEKSAAAFEKAISLDPKNVELIGYLARAHNLQGDSEKAASVMDRAISLDPDLGSLYMRKGDFIAAAGESAWERAGKVYGQALTAKNLDWETANTCGRNIWNIFGARQKLDEGLALVKGWTTTHPKNSGAWWWQGFYLFTKGDYDGARKDFEKAWNVANKGLPNAASYVAQCYWRMGAPADRAGMPNYGKADKKKLQKAFEWFAKAQAVPGIEWGDQPQPVDDMFRLFLGLQGNGRLDYGAEMIEKVCLPSAPGSWKLLNILGLYYRDKGGMTRGSQGRAMCKKSADYYERAAASVLEDDKADGPTKAQILNDTGVLFHFKNYGIDDMEKGMRLYRRALTHDPTYKDALENLAICLNVQGKYEEAIIHLKKVLEQEPGRRVARMELRKAERAIKD